MKKRLYFYLLALIVSVHAVSFQSFSYCEQAPDIPQDAPREDYLLSPSDEIEITVVGEEDISGTYRIDNEGYITFPVLNKVRASELTVVELEKKIASLLEKDYFKIKLSVYAQVKKFHKRKVIVAGEVKSPGTYEFEEGRNLSLVEVISLAGGPTEKACLNATTVIKPEGKGKTKTFKVRAGDMMSAKEKDIILTAGDRVNIPSANVIVMGEVAKPGTYGFRDDANMTLLGAVALAGGFTRIAAINKVSVIRVDETGTKKKIYVNVNDIYNGKTRDISLEPDDIIIVPESWF